MDNILAYNSPFLTYITFDFHEYWWVTYQTEDGLIVNMLAERFIKHKAQLRMVSVLSGIRNWQETCQYDA